MSKFGLPGPRSRHPRDSRRGRSTGVACGGGRHSDRYPSISGRGDEGGAETARLAIRANLSSSTTLRIWCRTPTVPMSNRPQGRRGENRGVAASVAGGRTPVLLTNFRKTLSALRGGIFAQPVLRCNDGGQRRVNRPMRTNSDGWETDRPRPTP